MAKKMTLNELGAMVEHVVKHMATKEDIAEVKATLDDHTKILDEHTKTLADDPKSVARDAIQNTIAAPGGALLRELVAYFCWSAGVAAGV